MLRSQVDAAHPNRATFNDGWIGDAAHQARKSDHNPNAAGVVQALDLSHDPAHGFDSYAFAELLRQKRDPRIKYVISNGRIFSSAVSAWQWRKYTGADSHSHHVHVSASDSPSLYDNGAMWDIEAFGTVPAAPQAPLLSSTVTAEQRTSMAKHILDFEARFDKDHHLVVYKLPSNDGGGSYEVAGINEKYDGPEAAKLKQMLAERKFDAALAEAESYILQNTNPAASWTTDAGVEYLLRDCVFNRGAHGAARILQRACGVKDDGQIGPISRAAIAKITPADLLTKLRAAREDYERNVVGYRANFWNGLVNRWNETLVIARTYQTAPQPGTKPMDAPATTTTATAAPDILAKIKTLIDSVHAQQGGTAPAALPGVASGGTDILSKIHALVGGAGTLSQLHGIDPQIIKGLETIVNFLPAIAKFVPQLAPAVAFVPLIQGGLNLIEEVQASGTNDPHAIFDIVTKHLHDVIANVQTLKASMQQTASPPQAA
jgi:hypothetical protein